MRKLFFLSVSLVFGLSFVSTVMAAGGGGGGGTSNCTEDTWACTDWGECSSQGKQTRTCRITFDCSNLDTPQPAREQTCVPPKVEPVLQPEPQTQTQPEPEVKTEPAPQSPALSHCTADTWKCDAWSACDLDGNQKKMCQKMIDCPGVDTSQPLITQRCLTLQCGNKATIRERVACRLSLTSAGLSRELEIEYLPEECRAFEKNSDKRKACIALYRAYKPCWMKPVGEERSACARQVLKLGPVLSDEVKKCAGDPICIQTVRERVFNMIKFRFYDLEERAEDLLEDGKASKEAVVEFTANVFENKQTFNAAKTKEERRKAILDMREAWKKFIAGVTRN